ncbi:MAG: hypothetical protein A3D39_00185 [Candidatus Buchananbacteria bacterium RIFCSPHIGHO2_02_FULL_39_17]|uniref:Uncharacterized protein n=1 Tax=Candidatus Buchananbacteria bacterium RIFCSPLOWO2_01_FULL_40_23b TaxID=1797544 RepID=A0A1G1YTW8_9BACT|nr:MAG: hypothetical protein A3D39_00185 [Candidatus Buchananbacteria bacterium RIFCSPHIGHO2_02_FULL_39_17]OGY55801.1 MAG: hypothetical protein A2912_01095 [Candidatus Buchananbacteria bacterium RIFCSPLOWO2_01_FULL_40_23b]
MANGDKRGLFDRPIVEREDSSKDNSDEIVLSLVDYNDLFSDFDSRQYSHRALSDDFLFELKQACRDKEGELNLNLLLPKLKRNPYHEALIKKRLKEHFKKHFERKSKEKNKIFRQGSLFVGFGIVLMMAAAYFLYQQYASYNFWGSIVVVILEPGSWFLFWEGLELLIFESKKHSPDLQFYEKMNSCKINFGERRKNN